MPLYVVSMDMLLEWVYTMVQDQRTLKIKQVY